MIDLRSDTVTVPTPAMREAMLAAPVGDDVYGEDPTIIELERRTAELLGHEAGLFCTTGSLANLLGVRLLVEPGQEVVCDVAAHIARAEMGAHAAVHGLTMRTVARSTGWSTWTPTPRSSRRAPARTWSRPQRSRWRTRTTSAAAPSSRTTGWSSSASCAARQGLGFHLDGARLWNAHVATGVPLIDYGSAVRHRQRLLLQGTRGAGRVGRWSAPPRTSLAPGSGANGSAAAGARPACSPPGPCTLWTITSTGSPTTTQAARGVRRCGGRAGPDRGRSSRGADQHRGAGHRRRPGRRDRRGRAGGGGLGVGSRAAHAAGRHPPRGRRCEDARTAGEVVGRLVGLR